MSVYLFICLDSSIVDFSVFCPIGIFACKGQPLSHSFPHSIRKISVISKRLLFSSANSLLEIVINDPFSRDF